MDICRTPEYSGEDGTLHKFWEVIKDPESLELLQIDKEVKMVEDPYKRVAAFWETLGIPDMTPYIKLNNE